MGKCSGFLCQQRSKDDKNDAVYNYHPKHYDKVKDIVTKKVRKSEQFRANGKSAVLCRECLLYESPWAKEDEDYTRYAKMKPGPDGLTAMCIICTRNGRLRTARYQINGEEYPTICDKCNAKDIDLKENTTCVTSKLCAICKTTGFNYNWSICSSGKYCKDCSEIVAMNKPVEYGDEVYMKDVYSKMCIVCDNHQPSFNWSILNNTLWCKACSLLQIKPEEYGDNVIMTDVRNNKCSCGKGQPTFNYMDQIKALYCKDCKKPDMINVRDDLCIGSICRNKPINERTRPSYNKIGETKKLYCRPCANAIFEDEEIANLVSHTCLENIDKNGNTVKCGKIADYGYVDKPKNHCAEHRKYNQVRRSNYSCFLCNDKAIYGINFQRMHCEKHKLIFEDLLTLQECKGCENTMIIGSNGLCEICNPCLRKNKYMHKQNILMQYLDQYNVLNNKIYSTDKIIKGGREGLARPDRVYFGIEFILIVECDEHQHYYYTSEDEGERMVNIMRSFAPLPVYFIRWNPDKYIPKNSENYIEYGDRHAPLADKIYGILYDINIIHTHQLNISYMYYDSSDPDIWIKYLPFQDESKNI